MARKKSTPDPTPIPAVPAIDWALCLPERWSTQRVRVALVGVGGTGSQVADQLASMQATLQQLGHPGFAVTAFDADRVSRANLGRQRFTAGDLGMHKALVLVHRINFFYGLDWTVECRHATPQDLHSFDLIITCTDSARTRVQIANHFRGRKTDALWADTGNAARTGQVVLGHLGEPSVTHTPRLPHVIDLYPELNGQAGAQADADDGPSCSTDAALHKQDWPVNRAAAGIAIELLWTLFRHGRIEHHGAHFSLNPLRTVPLRIDAATWAFYGYDRAA